jgi:uncharacterized membrane protein (UPF0127 family)
MIRRKTQLLFLVAAVAGCDKPPASGLPVVPMTIGSRQYQLEVAATLPAREHGLMERDDLPSDHGMIFVYDEPTTDEFWMHHTRFDLDIVFVDGSGKVVAVKSMKAYDEHTTKSDGPYGYAIEMAAGQAKACGVKVGDTLTIPADAKPKRATTATAPAVR